MNDVREIVTRAVVAKGQKLIKRQDEVICENTPYTILGCWIINHSFTGTLEDNKALITGSYEINIWYSYDNNTKTDVARVCVDYNKNINTKEIVKDINKETREIIVEVIQEPSCTNAAIVNNSICVDVCFELLVSVIGETRVRVCILDQVDLADYTDDDFEDEINENFINEE